MMINKFSETKMVRSSIPLGMHPLCDFVKKPLCAFVVKKSNHKGTQRIHKGTQRKSKVPKGRPFINRRFQPTVVT